MSGSMGARVSQNSHFGVKDAKISLNKAGSRKSDAPSLGKEFFKNSAVKINVHWHQELSV